MDRREFLTARIKPVNKTASTLTSSQTSSSLATYSGQWGPGEVIHLLKRTMFGASVADIRYFLGKSMSQSVDELLNPVSPLPSPPTKDYSYANTIDTNIGDGSTWVYDYSTDGYVNFYRRASFRRWWAALLITQDRSIREKMTLFWHNHFSTSSVMMENAKVIYKHHSMLRAGCLGNFPILVKSVLTDPGMLIFLNGTSNVDTSPNENLARELQECFLLGKENNPNYTETDVKTVARVLTGWGMLQADMSTTVFFPNLHDTKSKVFSSFYNNTVITGKSGNSAGDDEMNALLTMIFSKTKEVSNFIVKKIYRWFCYYNIDADIQANIIDPLAQIFVNSNWDIRAVLSALFKSDHFYSAAVRGCLIKNPADFVAGGIREFNLNVPDARDSTWDYNGLCDGIFQYIADMHLQLGDPPNVAGWPAYYQQPLYHRLWINSETLRKRKEFIDVLSNANITTRTGKTIKFDPIAFAKSLTNPSDPNQLISDSLLVLFSMTFSDSAKQLIKQQIVLSGQENDLYWTNAWNKLLANPNDSASYQIINIRLHNLYNYLMNLPEYQLA